MKQFDKKKIGFFTVIVMALLVFSSGAVAAETNKLFNGLWEGVDPDDGSTMQISIICDKSADGTCRLIARESYIHKCESNGEAGSEGWYEGTGQVATGNKRRLDVVDWTLHCLEDGHEVHFTSYFIVNRARNILIMSPHDHDFTDTILHRVSN
ncbi:hypothetical protein ACLHDG_10245 [Sulfurovum sp. CS9]|uniref:hypothetical protein n=1 Tax=Sulfurovum sp. CS9 TaxID=3391146 RepID=UPI0039EA617F